jgi:hypothetical protein
MMSAIAKVLGLVLATVAGLVLALGALLLASLVGVALVVRRLMGRRSLPAVARRRPAAGEVIDVEVREVASARR